METAKTNHLATQLARGEMLDANCPSREVLVHMTGKWNVLLLIALRDGTMRFAELRRKVNGVSERMLAKSLQQLERHHLLIRRSYPVVPPHVEYTLTPLGREAAERIAGLTDWIEENVQALIGEE
ncbi:helix-turn-helix domain-containing protein [Sphingomonas sp. 7/4-4]|uniref:winged helix-turn-helix transcriptional regulator n=1 Tax=Sphingomonas sp. 7/4-4 TaxID=3018446 RepID=UPI0022F3E948|nr:helix-turn-helix domain-containing protein [Sphingomonas sp. 7/4-4]WBY08020.1 helix-turn-helix domain-containing protein [Sphingomonas sp. 7/4-4]